VPLKCIRFWRKHFSAACDYSRAHAVVYPASGDMFTFKFKAVLEYRRHLEDICAQKFAASKRSWEQEHEKLEQFHGAWKNCLEEWRIMQKGAISVAGLDLHQKYMVRLRHEITRQVQHVKKSLEVMEYHRKKLIDARRDTEIMENLQEQQRRAHAGALARNERLFLDDIAMQRFNYKEKGR
jgi:flagellar protein FliJ